MVFEYWFENELLVPYAEIMDCSTFAVITSTKSFSLRDFDSKGFGKIAAGLGMLRAHGKLASRNTWGAADKAWATSPPGTPPPHI
jgi:hypothetical protein